MYIYRTSKESWAELTYQHSGKRLVWMTAGIESYRCYEHYDSSLFMTLPSMPDIIVLPTTKSFLLLSIMASFPLVDVPFWWKYCVLSALLGKVGVFALESFPSYLRRGLGVADRAHLNRWCVLFLLLEKGSHLAVPQVLCANIGYLSWSTFWLSPCPVGLLHLGRFDGDSQLSLFALLSFPCLEISSISFSKLVRSSKPRAVEFSAFSILWTQAFP
jgi:hypothetical protein